MDSRIKRWSSSSFLPKQTTIIFAIKVALDFHVNLTGGRPSLNFSHINFVQNAGSWDNHEQHAVNIFVPAGLKLGDIDSLHVHMQSGHCNDSPFDGDDGWNVSRIAVFAFLAPIESPPPPPGAPSRCKVSGDAVCGQVGFNCDPFSAGDEIVVSSGGIGVRVDGTAPAIGLITGTYFGEGTATVAVCARKAGLTSCGNPIPDVRFAPISTSCSGTGFHPPVCPTGLIPCQGTCRPANDPDCRPR
jgi:hypothetical protein